MRFVRLLEPGEPFGKWHYRVKLHCPKAPVKPPFGTKGRWHGVAVTEGLTTPQSASADSSPFTGEPFGKWHYRTKAAETAPLSWGFLTA